MADIWDEDYEAEYGAPPPPPEPNVTDIETSGPAAPIAGPIMRSLAQHKGNTPVGDVAAARSMVIAEATGRGVSEPDAWREQLKGGEKSKAASELGGARLTHNAGSGFGLA